MYKSRQLMRLNKVLHKGDIKTVDCITPGHISFIEDRKGNGVFREWVDLDDVGFIPLTEEWLLKFSFKDVLVGSYKAWDKVDPYSFRIEPNEDGILCHDETCTDLPYVHSIQNLYFAITGKELTI